MSYLKPIANTYTNITQVPAIIRELSEIYIQLYMLSFFNAYFQNTRDKF